MRVSTIAYLFITSAVLLALVTVIWIAWLNRGSRHSRASYSEETAAKLFVLGEALALLGNMCIAGGMTMQKLVANRLAELLDAPKNTEYAPFWLAMLLLMGGEIGNFSALGFASPTVVSPLGAVSVLASSVFAVLLLGESLNYTQLAGLGLIIFGTLFVVLCAPRPDDAFSFELFL